MNWVFFNFSVHTFLLPAPGRFWNFVERLNRVSVFLEHEHFRIIYVIYIILYNSNQNVTDINKNLIFG